MKTQAMQSVLAATIAVWFLTVGCASDAPAAILSGGQPDPNYDGDSSTSADMLLWLRADMGFTAGATTSWADQSTLGSVFSQSAAAQQATLNATGLGGQATIDFDGDDWFSQSSGPTITGHQTAFFVYQDTSTASWVTPLGTSYNGDGSYHGNSNDSAIFNGTYTDPRTLNGTNLRGGSDIGTGQSTPRPDSYVIDAHVATSPLVQSITHVGADNFMPTTRAINGGIAEILLYDRALNTTELNDLGNYLEGRYGLTWTDFVVSNAYNSAASGDWSTPATWSPAAPTGGPQPADTASIGAHSVDYDAAAPGTIKDITFTSSTGPFTLERDLTVTGDLIANQTKTINLGSNTLTVDGTFRNGFISVNAGAINRTAGGKLDINNLAWYRASFTLDPVDEVTNLIVSNANGATVVFGTSATGNIANNVTLQRGGAGGSTTLSLGADLVLVGGASIRESTIADNGFNITIAGALTNAASPGNTGDNPNGGGLMRAGGVLDIDSVVFGRTGFVGFRPGDTIQSLLRGYRFAGFVGQLPDFEVLQESAFGYDPTQGLTLNSAATSALDLGDDGAGRSELTLTFDDLTMGGALAGAPLASYDWAFRWLGDHTSDLQALFASGQLIVDTGAAPVLFNPTDNIYFATDGYTYVGFGQLTAAVPEPGSLAACLWCLGTILGVRRVRAAGRRPF